VNHDGLDDALAVIVIGTGQQSAASMHHQEMMIRT